MDEFSHVKGRLHCEGVAVEELAERYGTPLYIYSLAAITGRFDELKSAFASAKPLISYSVKANSNLSILRVLARRGAGFDIVSGGELFRALKAGARPDKIVFAGVGKTRDEIRAAVKAGIRLFDVESPSELGAINREAADLKRTASVALRLNPDVDARTNAKTTTGKKENKFGIDLDRARMLFADREKYPHVFLRGIHMHLGSPIYSVTPYQIGLAKAAQFINEVRELGAKPDTLNIGGGYAISYDGKTVIGPADYAKVIVPAVKALGMKLILEPGRYIIGNSAILLSRITYIKDGWLDRRFVILDAAMNDLLRPALYDAYHHVWPVKGAGPFPAGRRASAIRLKKVDIVGPICETSDCFGRDREIPPVKEGDLMAIYSAGAYGMAMSSQYNSRPRPAEVLVSGRRHRLIRRRETYEDLVSSE